MRTSYRGKYQTKRRVPPPPPKGASSRMVAPSGANEARSQASILNVKSRAESRVVAPNRYVGSRAYSPVVAPLPQIPNFTTGVPTTGSGGGGGGGGGGSTTPVTWTDKYTVANAPSWWKGMLPSSYDAETSYASLMNNMIPFLSPEDQRAVASNLSRLYPTAFGNYSPEKVNFGTPPSELTTEMRDLFTSSTRGQAVLTALDRLKAASGVGDDKLGPGYQFLRNVSKTMQDFGGGVPGSGTHQTRRQYLQMMSALDPLLAETKGEQLGAFGPLAQSLVTPFFSGGSLVPVSKDANGNWVFGQPNKGWF